MLVRVMVEVPYVVSVDINPALRGGIEALAIKSVMSNWDTHYRYRAQPEYHSNQSGAPVHSRVLGVEVVKPTGSTRAPERTITSKGEAGEAHECKFCGLKLHYVGLGRWEDNNGDSYCVSGGSDKHYPRQ